MDSTDVTPLLGWGMLIVAGGLVGSFGLNSIIKSRLGRAFIRRWRWWGIGLYYVVVVGGIVGGFGYVFALLLRSMDDASALESPWIFLTFGLAAGLPFTLPPMTTIWREERSPRRAAREKTKTVSAEERLEYAKELERQLAEYVGDMQAIAVRTSGDRRAVLQLEGDLDRERGERLVAALRADIEAHQFQRVEGGPPGSKKWWVRI